MLDVGDAEAGHMFLALVDDAHGHAGHLQPLHGLFDTLMQLRVLGACFGALRCLSGHLSSPLSNSWVMPHVVSEIRGTDVPPLRLQSPGTLWVTLPCDRSP